MLYGMTDPGVPVIISDGELVPQPIDHPTLFHPEAPAAMPLLSDVELRPSMRRIVLGVSTSTWMEARFRAVV